MPIPKPRDNETEDEFISRCMGDDVMNEEYPGDKQRSAICYSQWRDKKMLEHKSVKFAIKQLDEETGIFEGYAATFSDDPDAYGDVIEKGAFTKTIQEGIKRIKILFNHNAENPIGKPMEIVEDEKGLYVKGKLTLGVQKAREVLALMKDQVITELSIGYDAILAPMEKGIRHLKEVRLWDISPVVFAANQEAMIMRVKNKKQGNIDALVNTWDEWAGSFTKCADAISGKPGITDPESLCAWMEHEATGNWPAEKDCPQIEEIKTRLETPALQHKEEPPTGTLEDAEAAELEEFYNNLVAQNDIEDVERQLDTALNKIKGGK